MSVLSLSDLPAPAKINLFLHVIGRRPDGYHLLQSAFVLIDWMDTLHLERRADGRLARHDLGPTLPADDLCLRAAKLLQTESGCGLGADITIDKQIPWGAGMGGGSSDAATVLLGLNQMWDLRWSRAKLQALGARIGADVPFFIGGGHAIVEGIGDILTPLQVPASAWAVVKPVASISTAAIFGSKLLKRDAIPDTVMGLLSGAQSALSDTADQALPGSTHGSSRSIPRLWGRNDLQAAAQAVCPEVAEVAHWLESRFGNSRMTGSGSAVFARIDAGSRNGGSSHLDAEVFSRSLGWQPGWVGRMCQSLDQHPLAGWLG